MSKIKTKTIATIDAGEAIKSQYTPYHGRVVIVQNQAYDQERHKFMCLCQWEDLLITVPAELIRIKTVAVDDQDQ